MGSAAKTLYEKDFVEWSDRTAELLRAGRFSELHIENVAEVIKDLGESVRRSVRSQLQRLMMHKLKQGLQPERNGKRWRTSIASASARDKILDELEGTSSLRSHLEQNLERVYKLVAKEALRETAAGKKLPVECPWTLEALLKG